MIKRKVKLKKSTKKEKVSGCGVVVECMGENNKYKS